MKTSLFGTDGIRGRANEYPVTPEIALQLGRAVAQVFSSKERRPQIVVGKDTRISGYMLESALASGITSMGVDVILVGPLPTPAIAYLTRTLRAAAGVVISASHNPFQDNGLKVFRGDGFKCSDEVEAQLEELILHPERMASRPSGAGLGKAHRIDKPEDRYAEMAKNSFPENLNLIGMTIAVDAANGAAYETTPAVLRELGADVKLFHAHPDGLNINANCGSTHPEVIQQLVRDTGAHIGIAHDGDADRLICCDEKGEIVDGDEILAITSLDLLQRGKLAQNTLVATVMSNFGLEECLEAAGGKVIRTAVGDRYVMQEMATRKLNVGGEQSGHMIFLDHSTTGDGLVSALQVLRVMRETGRPLSELKKCLRKYPQLLVNLKVREKKPLESLGQVQEAVRKVEAEFDGKGRVLLRYSGTEPKVRLLLEGRDAARLQVQADEILGHLRAALGEG